MARAIEAYQDGRGNLHDSPTSAIVADIAAALGRVGEEIVVGDVLAVEPGLYRKGFGGCRLEDLALVTEDGCEVLTDFPYDLTP